MNTVIITNAVHTFKRDCVYTAEQRLDQLVTYTIPSIHKYINNPFIILVENSVVSQEEEKVLHSLCNLYINTGEHCTNMVECTGSRELYGLNTALANIPENTAWVYKISGRYNYTDIFKTLQLHSFKINFHTAYIHGKTEYNPTSWAIPQCMLKIFKSGMNHTFEYISLPNHSHLLVPTLAQMFPSSLVNPLNYLGVHCPVQGGEIYDL